MSGSSGGTTQSSTISAEQRQSLQSVMDWVTPYLEGTTAGAEYPGQLTADRPDLFGQAYENFAGMPFADIENQAIQDLISGRPAYEFDPVQTASRWQETFAEPVMNTWRETIAPVLKEEMNMPGTFYGRSTSDYLAKKGGEFYGGQVAPSLFSALQTGEVLGAQSLDRANMMRPGAMSLPYMQFAQGAGVSGALQGLEQQELGAMYQEFIRRDPYRYAQLLAGIGSSATYETVATQGTASPWGQIAGGMAGGFMGGDAFGTGGGGFSSLLNWN